MLIAIDHGNSAVKTPRVQFCSGLAEHLTKPPLAEEIIEYDGRYWTLSNSRIPYKRDKTRDNSFFILSLFAIVKELAAAGPLKPLNTVDLAVGLPPEHFGNLREGFKSYFKKPCPVQFIYNGTKLCLTVRHVFVYPQAYAAVATQDAQLVQQPTLFVVDIGGMTTDVLLLRAGRPDLQFCRSLETGIITMQNQLIGKVNSLHDMLIDDEHIAAVLRSGETILPVSVQETIRAAAGQHANTVLDKLRELQVDLRSNPAVFIGGGSILLKEYLQKSPLVAQADFITDPKANAKGYEMLAMEQLQRMGRVNA
jgi:plasmid segregation protein ParM